MLTGGNKEFMRLFFYGSKHKHYRGSSRVRTDDGELRAGRVVVQAGVHDAGVHALVSLRHLADGQAVGVHDEPAWLRAGF